MRKNTLGSLIQGFGILAGSLAFSRNFGEVKDETKSEVKGGYRRNQDLESKIKVVGILAHVCLQANRNRNAVYE